MSNGFCPVASFPVASTGEVDATVALTGVSATAAAGSLTALVGTIVNLVGVAATAQAGSFSIQNDSNVGLVGVAGAANTGTLGIVIDASAILTGVSASGQAGSLGNAVSFRLNGVSGVGIVGIVTPTFEILTIPLITIMNDNPVPVSGGMDADYVAAQADMPSQIALETVLNTNPIPMTGLMVASPVLGEGFVP